MPEEQMASSETFIKRISRFLKIDYIILVIMASIHAVNNYIWLKRDQIPPTWDSAQYLTFSFQYHNLFSNPTSNFIATLFEINRQRPPLRLIIPSPFYSIAGISADVAVMTNVIFILILLFSVYGIGKIMFSRETGLVAAILVSFFPIIHGLSRSFLLDFPTTAMVALSIYLLLRTENFSNKKYSVLFGLSMGLGILVKDTYPVFILGSLVYVMYKSGIFKIGWLIKTLIRNYFPTLLAISSGAAIGLYIYYLVSNVFWTGDQRITGLIAAIVIAGSTILLMSIWMMWSLALNTFTKNNFRTILLKNSISFSSFLILLLVFVVPENTSNKNIFMLAPVSLLIFVILHFIFLKSIYKDWWANRKIDRYKSHPWLNFFRGSIMALIISIWWYGPSASGVLPNLFLNPTYVKPEEGHVNLSSWESLSYYFLGLLNQQIYLFFFVFVICLIFVVIRYGKPILMTLRKTRITQWMKTLSDRDWKTKFSLFLWIAVPYLFFSLSHTKNSRYITPYLPAIAIGMAAAMMAFPNRWQKVTAVLVVLGIGGFQLVTHSYGISELPEMVTIDTPAGELLIFGQGPLGRHQYNIHPDPDDWQIDDVLSFINEDHRKQSNAGVHEKLTIEVGTITDGRVNAYVFQFNAFEEGLKINIQSTAFYETQAWTDNSAHSFYKNFDKLDYIIELENYTLRSQHNLSQKFFHEPDNFGLFERINSFDLPDGSNLVIYRRN